MAAGSTAANFMAALVLTTLTVALGEPYAWESPTTYHYASVAGDAATCCGATLVGDPTAGIVPYNCPTDLTAGVCDPGSCCDPDCSAGTLATVDGVFSCPELVTPFSRSGVLYCSDALPLSTVNLPVSARADGWATTEWNDMLCVYKDNSPSIGSFYSDPAAVPLTEQQVMNEIEAAAGSTFSTSLSAAPTTDTSSSFYRLGDPVLGEGCATAGGTSGCSALAPLQLPEVAPEGSCALRGRSIPYLTPVPPYTCEPAAANSLAQLCTSSYAAQLVTSLNRGTNPAIAAAPNLGLQLSVAFMYRFRYDRSIDPFVYGLKSVSM